MKDKLRLYSIKAVNPLVSASQSGTVAPVEGSVYAFKIIMKL